MADCFPKYVDGTVACAICGHDFKLTSDRLSEIGGDLSLIHRDCDGANANRLCIHRGEAIRSELCPSCAGSVKVKVFACAIHGECEMGGKLKHLKRCGVGACDDYS